MSASPKNETKTLKAVRERIGRPLPVESIPYSPGPGAYDTPSNFGAHMINSTTITIKGRPNEQTRDDIPGPGAYSPLSPEKNNYKFTMGAKGTTSLTPRNDKVPGPGEYSLKSSIGEDKK
jgi:hypothetical protein